MEKLRILQDQIPGNQLSQNASRTTVEMKICPEHGEYPRYHKLFSGKVREQGCPICREDNYKKRMEEEKAREHASRIKQYLHQCNVPKRHSGKKFREIDLKHQKNNTYNLEMAKAVKVAQGFLKTWADRLEQGASGFFCGECGTGKTMLACMMVEAVAGMGYQSRYTTAWEMIQHIRRSYKTGESTKLFINEYIHPALLVIDEIGVQNGSQDERVLMYQVIDGRYNEVKPTILISNSKNPVDDGFLDMRTIDRLKEGGGFSITFNGESYRK